MHLYGSMRGVTRDRDNKVHIHTHIYTSTSPLPENRKDVEIVAQCTLVKVVIMLLLARYARSAAVKRTRT